MNRRRREPAWLHGLMKRVTEVKDGPLELMRRKGTENVPGKRKRGNAREYEREREREREREIEREREREMERCILYFMGFYLEVSGEDLNRIFISFLGVSFQACGL